ncbi:wall-associated receptor kinase-like 6 [Ziziphus jujuba]|uniref:Wall-associated receptor kinase-like 6 n=1 Tax=Ziziphus jujuba TaxID=326968 RepID=A0A6P6FRL2_ZIZJJ|nr:wall-associated receptor kinase-like 6 [Ziziphus jujuba]
MVGQVMLFHIVLLSWPIIHTVALGGAIAKPGCPSDCGNNVSIPFPFGIGAGCYVDEWFEIVCNNSANRPFLKRTNLEVLNVYTSDYTTSSSGQISSSKLKVRYPISFQNCTGKESHKPDLNLTGSPFMFSVTDNIFTAVSCDVRATMSSSNVEGAEISAGCKSICSNSTNNNNSSCNGLNCCQTTIPSFVETFTTTFETTGTDRDKACKYAFMVDQNWFGSSNTMNFVDIGDMDDVPVTLDWSLHYSENEIFGTEFAAKNSLTYSCYESNSTFSFIIGKFLVCQCFHGFEGNPYLPGGCQDIDECKEHSGFSCGSGATCVNTIGSFQCQGPKANMLAVGFGSGFGALFLLIGAWGLYKFIKKRNDTKRKQNFFKRNGGLLLQQQISSGEVNVEAKTPLFDSKELEKATDHFNVDRILGQGGQGTVYKGMLTDGKIVAVKKSQKVNESKVSEFINEVVILSQVNHRNVVKLLGCCLETEVPLLVYEFIPNGTLYQYIHDQSGEFPLTWETRLRIATEAAGALSYLHSAASYPIFHRDVKSSNILLDDKYRAKLADFGTSRTIIIGQTHLTTMVHGTFGYLDPEYFQSSKFTEKSDVYSFGVVLVELLTGQKPICSSRIEEGQGLASYFIMYMEENRLFEIIDDRILQEGGNEKIITAIAILAKRCLNLKGKYRPTMKEVTMELEAIYKSAKTSSVHQNFNYDHQEVEYVSTGVTEPWDASFSIGSNVPSYTNSSSDVVPLMSS